jgi:hypothetical protein
LRKILKIQGISPDLSSWVGLKPLFFEAYGCKVFIADSLSVPFEALIEKELPQRRRGAHPLRLGPDVGLRLNFPVS